MDIDKKVLKYFENYDLDEKENCEKFNIDSSFQKHFNQNEMKIIQTALSEESLNELNEFKQLLKRVIATMQNKALIIEWNTVSINETQFLEKCSNSISWHLLLQSLNPLIHPNILETFPSIENVPKTLLIRQSLYASIIFQLYLSLIYNREILIRIIKKDIRKDHQQESINNLKGLLNCDYIRHMRNSLAHGSFELFFGGICFYDREKAITATYSMLERLASWLNLITLQCMK